MLPVVRWQIVADFLALNVAFYALLRWARSARALRIALSVVGLHVLALPARRLDLVVTSWVLDASAILATLVLLLIFQFHILNFVCSVSDKPLPRLGMNAGHLPGIGYEGLLSSDRNATRAMTAVVCQA